MTQSEVIDKIRAAAQEVEGKSRLSCTAAFELKKQLGVSLKDIGSICDDEGIKIMNCQLGCFK